MDPRAECATNDRSAGRAGAADEGAEVLMEVAGSVEGRGRRASSTST